MSFGLINLSNYLYNKVVTTVADSSSRARAAFSYIVIRTAICCLFLPRLTHQLFHTMCSISIVLDITQDILWMFLSGTLMVTETSQNFPHNFATKCAATETFPTPPT